MDCLSLLLAFMVVVLILTPALVYLVEGRRYRRQMILAYFSPDVVCDYFRQFWSGNSRFSEVIDDYKSAAQAAGLPSGTPEEQAERAAKKLAAEIKLTDQFQQLYDDRFGWFKYFTPFAALALILIVEARFVAEFVDLMMAKSAKSLTEQPVAAELLQRLTRLPDRVAVAAMAGAYLAIGLDLFRRVSSLILLPSDLWFYALRLIVAPILGHVAGSFAGVESNSAVLVAFTIAVLPIGDILLWIRTKGAKAAGVEDRPEEARDKPIRLPGVDSNVAARLEDQGVSTIMQLCEVDPVLLSMRTGFDFTYVVRLVDEAIAWRYFGDKLPSLSVFGWTGASAMLTRTTGTGSGGVTPIDKAEEAYQRAYTAWQTAKTASDSASPQDPALVAAATAAKSAFDIARKEWREAWQYQFNKDLTAEIAKPESKLSALGIENVLRQINDDGYARFIAGLLKSSAGQAAPKKPQTFWDRVVSIFGGTT